MAKRKMKTHVKYSLLAVLLVTFIVIIFVVINNRNKSNDQEYHGQIIQDGGNMEIIIPDELDTDGF